MDFRITSKLLVWAMLLSSSCVLCERLSAKSYTAQTVAQFEEIVKQLVAGDELVMKDGLWRDANLLIQGEGTAEQPITIRAATPGKVVLTGASRLRISGQYVQVIGLKLHNLTGQKADWIEFRKDSKKLANHCSLKDCWLLESDDFQPTEKENRWIGIYGHDNRLENCRIEGKKNKGATVVVWLGKDNLGEHIITHNYFVHRPRLGKNGGETLRVGDSDTSMQSAKCLIEGNLFERCNGETECISNKSCDNVYRSNTFLEVQGTLTLRHGNNCLVERNIFLGNHVSGTGGIRVIGEGHRVRANYLSGLEGDGFRTALTLVNGQPDAALNGYHPVRNVTLEDNTIVDCKHSVLLNYNDQKDATISPYKITFTDQRIIARNKRMPLEIVAVDKPLSTLPEGYHFEGNVIQCDTKYRADLAGITYKDSVPVAAPESLKPSQVGPTWLASSSDSPR